MASVIDDLREQGLNIPRRHERVPEDVKCFVREYVANELTAVIMPLQDRVRELERLLGEKK